MGKMNASLSNQTESQVTIYDLLSNQTVLHSRIIDPLSDQTA